MSSFTTITTMFSVPLVLLLTTLNFALSKGDPCIARQRERQMTEIVFETTTIWKFWEKDVLEGKLY